MRRSLVWLLCAIVGVLMFLFGLWMGDRAAFRELHQIDQRVAALNAIARYDTAAAISSDIRDGKLYKAKCRADLIASAFFRDVRQCLAQEPCRSGIQDRVAKEVPEVLRNDRSRFVYYENLESCGSK